MDHLARTSQLKHEASGVELQTPLLIPSFSSKGFARKSEDNKSEVRDLIAFFSEFITDVALVSAYDIHYGHVQPPSELPLCPELTFVDSGGYEVSTDRDYSSVIDPVPMPDPWNENLLRQVYGSWPNTSPAVLVSYDHPDSRAPYAEQVKAAATLFSDYPSHLHLFLIKPSPEHKTVQSELKTAAGAAGELTQFDIIGVTEKELGSSVLDRMAEIAKFRQALDKAEVATPIHVFGALDPIAVRLYFLAGAEIFDGLTWLRYGYRQDLCMYLHNVGVLEYGLNAKENQIKTRAMTSNYYSLGDLRMQLQEFEYTRSFDKFAPHGDLLAKAWDTLCTRLQGC